MVHRKNELTFSRSSSSRSRVSCARLDDVAAVGVGVLVVNNRVVKFEETENMPAVVSII